MGRGRDGESPGSARDAPVDVFAQAEALNDLSKTYDVEIDGVPLQRMSTSELSKLAATRGLPLSHARGELIAAIARDELQSRANEKHPETRDGFERSSPSALRDATPAPTNVAAMYEEMNASDEEGEGEEEPAPESYLVGAASVVWEGELYKGPSEVMVYRGETWTLPVFAEDRDHAKVVRTPFCLFQCTISGVVPGVVPGGSAWDNAWNSAWG